MPYHCATTPPIYSKLLGLRLPLLLLLLLLLVKGADVRGGANVVQSRRRRRLGGRQTRCDAASWGKHSHARAVAGARRARGRGRMRMTCCSSRVSQPASRPSCCCGVMRYNHRCPLELRRSSVYRFLLTAHVSGQRTAIGRVRPSVSPSVLTPVFEPTDR